MLFVLTLNFNPTFDFEFRQGGGDALLVVEVLSRNILTNMVQRERDFLESLSGQKSGIA